MKSLNNYIIEGLKIKANTKINSLEKQLAEDILESWCLDVSSSKEEYKVVLEWIQKNKISDVYYAADKETIESMNSVVEGDYSKWDTDEDLNEQCQDYLSKADNLYTYKSNGEKYDIYGSEEMICICSYSGTLYCIDSKIIDK